jgi:hypothetical protein
MTKKYNEIPGNTLASQALFDRQMIKIGVSVLTLQEQFIRLSDEGIEVKALRLAYRSGVSGELLGVLTASTESSELVAFQSGTDLAVVLTVLQSRLANGSLKWKEDEYAK